jgi:hypothetical protein
MQIQFSSIPPPKLGALSSMHKFTQEKVNRRKYGTYKIWSGRRDESASLFGWKIDKGKCLLFADGFHVIKLCALEQLT